MLPWPAGHMMGRVRMKSPSQLQGRPGAGAGADVGLASVSVTVTAIPSLCGAAPATRGQSEQASVSVTRKPTRKVSEGKSPSTAADGGLETRLLRPRPTNTTTG